MKNRYAVLITLLVILLPLAAFAGYNYDVLFTKPKIEQVTKPEMQTIYLENYGDYAKAPEFIKQVYEATSAAGIPCQMIAGQYYHNFVVPVEKRYARYVCVVEDMPKVLPAGFKAGTLPAGDYLVSARERQGALVNIALSTRLKIHAHSNDHTLVPYMLEIYELDALEKARATVWQPIAKYNY